MGFWNSFKLVYFEELFKVSSRSSRWEYWGSGLLFFLFYILIYVIFFILGTYDSLIILDVLTTVWGLIASITVSIRRMHDVGKSGWVLLWYFTIVGAIYILVLALTSSEQGANKWGNPREHTLESAE